MKRDILHCDMNNFYASVECMLKPSLKGKPVAVCGSVEERHGIVLAKNYPAKAFGVQTGEAIWQAKQKCPDLIVVEPHFDEYLRYSKLARQIYKEYAECVEPYGMDECWLDISGTEEIFGKPYDLANIIKERIKFELGLTISVGVSFNKIFAKLGSDMKKPDAVTELTKENFKEKIFHLPASDMLGVGPSTYRTLNRYGVITIGDLASCTIEFLSHVFGKNGVPLWIFANGLDESVVAKGIDAIPIKSVGHGITSRTDLTSNENVKCTIIDLSQEIAHRLRLLGCRAGGIAISVRDNELCTNRWQTINQIPVQSSYMISEVAYLLFLNRYDWHLPIRTITIQATRLVPEDEAFNLNLFKNQKIIERDEKIDTCVDEIRTRFGDGAVRNGILFKGNYVPIKHSDLVMPTGMVR